MAKAEVKHEVTVTLSREEAEVLRFLLRDVVDWASSGSTGKVLGGISNALGGAGVEIAPLKVTSYNNTWRLVTLEQY